MTEIPVNLLTNFGFYFIDAQQKGSVTASATFHPEFLMLTPVYQMSTRFGDSLSGLFRFALLLSGFKLRRT